MVCSVTTLSPGFRYWPGLTSVMPSRPVNGARIVFLSMVACWLAAWARLLFKSAASLSTCAWEIASAASCAWSRVSVTCAKSAAALSEASCARSESAFSWTRTAPALVSSPDLKRISRTRPAISVVTSTPRMARKLPTAFSCGCQSCWVAFMAVTTTAGWGADPWAICPMMFRNTTKPITATRSSTPKIMMIMRFVTEFLSFLEVVRGRRKACKRVASVPPAAAERLKKRRRVRKALRARLDQSHGRVLLALFRAQHLYVARAAALVLRLNQRKTAGSGALGERLRRQRVRVGLQCIEGVRHVFKGGDDGGLIVGGRFLRGGNRGAALMQELSALEYRLRQRTEKAVDVRARRK